MGLIFTTFKFTVAPSKEHHPLVSDLFKLGAIGFHSLAIRVRVSRHEGFLCGAFELTDYYVDRRAEAFMFGHKDFLDQDDDEDNFWEGEESLKEFAQKYRVISDLGYISNHDETPRWCSNEDNSEQDYDPDDEDCREAKRAALGRFWENFPNLMQMQKDGLAMD